jgi:hypothetical protein
MDKACATDTAPQSFRSAYASQSQPVDPLSPDWDWDRMVRDVLPGHLLLYGSDVHNVSILSHERRLGGGGGGGGGEGLPGLDMTRLSAADCLYRAVMASDGLSWPGMSTCYTYFGRAHAVFAAHAEDHNLPSVNQLVWGAPKVWYAVPGEHFRAASDALRGCVARGELPACAQALGHKLLLPSLAALHGAGLPVSRLLHFPGDIVITAPGAVHWGINCGDNVAESTNVADGAWLTDHGAYKAFLDMGPCTCKDGNKWGLIPRVWLPRGFLEGRLLGPAPAPAAAIEGGEGGGGGGGEAAIAAAVTAAVIAVTPAKGKKRRGSGTTPRPAKRSFLEESIAAAAAAAAAPKEAPPGSIAAHFSVPLAALAPPSPTAEEGGGGGAAAAAASSAAAAEAQVQSFAWYVAEVLEHRLRGKRQRLQFRVRWVGLRKTDRRHKKWHPIEIFKTEGAEGRVPGEVSCTLLDAKVGAYMEANGLLDVEK